METKKLAKTAKTEANNSTILHSKNFKINKIKSQGNESVIIDQLLKIYSSLKTDKIVANKLSEEASAYS